MKNTHKYNHFDSQYSISRPFIIMRGRGFRENPEELQKTKQKPKDKPQEKPADVLKRIQKNPDEIKKLTNKQKIMLLKAQGIESGMIRDIAEDPNNSTEVLAILVRSTIEDVRKTVFRRVENLFKTNKAEYYRTIIKLKDAQAWFSLKIREAVSDPKSLKDMYNADPNFVEERLTKLAFTKPEELLKDLNRISQLPIAVNIVFNAAIVAPKIVFENADKIKKLPSNKGLTPGNVLLFVAPIAGEAAFKNVEKFKDVKEAQAILNVALTVVQDKAFNYVDKFKDMPGAKDLLFAALEFKGGPLAAFVHFSKYGTVSWADVILDAAMKKLDPKSKEIPKVVVLAENITNKALKERIKKQLNEMTA